MAKLTSALLPESFGPHQLTDTRATVQTASGAVAIAAGSIVGRKPAGDWANAGVATVVAPYGVACSDVDSTSGAQSFDIRQGRFLIPNVGGFYTIAKQFKEVDFTSPEGGMALLAGTGCVILGLDAKTNKIIVSIGEQLPSI
jgi:hypothetical protein